jgi:hypothetical protein
MAGSRMTVEEGQFTSGSLWAAEDAGAVVRRVWYAQPAVGALMAVVAAATGDWRDAVGVVVGVGLAMVNFRYLSNSLRAILGAGHDTAPPGTTMMFVFRWIIVATAVAAIYQSGFASLGGVFAGLFAPAVAIALEAGFQTAHALRRHDDENPTR